jgi:hypothetical protein
MAGVEIAIIIAVISMFFIFTCSKQFERRRNWRDPDAFKRRDREGETLRSIGRSYNVSAATIARL